jgi:hypothetical protein
MNKRTVTKEMLAKTIQTTQAIEGYRPPSEETVKKAQQLREKHGIKVSAGK